MSLPDDREILEVLGDDSTPLGKVDGTNAMIGQVAKALNEATGLLRGPQRVVPLIQKLVSDKMRSHIRATASVLLHDDQAAQTETLNSIAALDSRRSAPRWRHCGLLQLAHADIRNLTRRLPATSSRRCTISRMPLTTSVALVAAERATRWLLSLQMPTGAFPGGLHGGAAQALGLQYRPDPARIGSRLRGDEPSRNPESGRRCWRLAGPNAAGGRIVVRAGRISGSGAHVLQHGGVGARGVVGAHREIVNSTGGREKSGLGIVTLPRERLDRWHQSAWPPELSALHRLCAAGRS